MLLGKSVLNTNRYEKAARSNASFPFLSGGGISVGCEAKAVFLLCLNSMH